MNGFDGLDFGAHEHGIHLAVGPDRMHLMLEGLGLAILGWTTIQVTKAGIFNNAGQHWNHIMFWQCMKPNGGGAMPSELENRIISDFGSVDKFKEDFIQAGVTQFGSGWAWLAIDNGKLVVTKSANTSNPLVDGMKPIFGCDVWEHSYYIDFRNRRPDYLKAFLDNLANWEFVASQLV